MIRFFLYMLLLLVSAGCAATSTTVIDEEVVTNPKPMYSYRSLLIRDLDRDGDAVSANQAATTAVTAPELRYEKLPGELSQHIERYVKSHNIYKTVSRVGVPDAETLVLAGRFTRIGRFKISIVISLRDGATGEEVAYFRQTLWDVLDTKDSISDLGHDVADFINRIQYK